ncbi:MAG TPA: hypothetical protein VFS34_02970 [Thermoanaerobaculia bacterium]|nr:hypothetical protein [Thermoanaerobaculia bacterium]
MKFARNVHFQIKKGKETEFTTVWEKEILPLLRKQNGFQEEVNLLDTKGAEFISLWDSKKNAETYEHATYPQVLAKLNPFLEGTPKVVTYENASSYRL